MMNARKAVLIGICALVAFGAWASGGPEGGAAGESVTMRLATIHPETYPNGQANKKFAEMVEKATNGRVKIVVYYAGELGDQKSYI